MYGEKERVGWRREGARGEIVGTRPSHGLIALVILNDVIPNLLSFCSKYGEREGGGGGGREERGGDSWLPGY